MRMGRRKRRTSETLKARRRRGEEDQVGRSKELDEGDKPGFFACYLLTSLCPRYKGRTYIGFTVNPRRRIRQHNGELCSGARRTKSKRPWEMVLCVYGFPTSVAALQFEWAWQHPVESLAVRKAAAAFKSLAGLANKIKLAYTMLTLPAWQNLNLTVNFFSTKYTHHYGGCPSLPSHMRVQIQSMEELPCYKEHTDNVFKLQNDSSDDDKINRTHGSYKLEATMLTVPVLDSSADNQKNNEEPSNDYYGETDCSRGSNDKDETLTKICPSHDDVEVIDLFSPSPEYGIGFRTTKRGFLAVCPKIIDLTQSPLVQL